MSQRLHIRFKKDGSARGVAIRKTNTTTNKNINTLINTDNEEQSTTDNTKQPSILRSLFSLAYQQHLLKNGKSQNKIA